MKLQLLLAGAVLASGISLSSCGKKEEWEKIDMIAIQQKEDGRWSLMNEDGEIYYEDMFKNRPSASYNGYFSVLEDDGYTLYESGNKKPKRVGNCKNLVSVGAFEDGLIPVTFPGKRISIVDGEGKEKFVLKPVSGSEITACWYKFDEGMLPFKTEDGKIGYYNEDGKVAIKPIYDNGYPFSEGLALVQKDDNWKVIDKEGKDVFKIKEDYSVTVGFEHGYLMVIDDDRWLLLDKNGKAKKLPSKVRWITDYNDDYLIYNDGDAYGVLDIDDDKQILTAKYRSIEFYDSSSFFVETEDGEYLILNKKGEKKKELDYKEVAFYHQFGFIVKYGKNSSW